MANLKKKNIYRPIVSAHSIVFGGLSKRDGELLLMASIRTQLPMTFDNGKRLTELNGTCPTCKRLLNIFRGKITKVSPEMFSLEAIGVCLACRECSQITFRFYDDDSMATPVPGRGWVRFKRKPKLGLLIFVVLFFRLIKVHIHSFVMKRINRVLHALDKALD
jgi:hypothetical protein